MSQRSPHNARYQRFTKPKGQTRKSAAAAKPKREGSAPSPSQSKTAARGRAPLPPLPPEVKIWRNAWWIMLGLAIVFSAVSFALAKSNAGFPIGPLYLTWRGITLVIAYLLIFGGLAIDLLKVRPVRQAQMAKRSGGAPKSKDSEKSSDKSADKRSGRSGSDDAPGPDDDSDGSDN